MRRRMTSTHDRGRGGRGKRTALLALMLLFAGGLVFLLVSGGVVDQSWIAGLVRELGAGSYGASTQQLEPRAWDEAAAPNYYELVGPAVVADVPEVGTVRYAPLDLLGRAGKVEACVNAQLAMEGAQRERGDTSGIHPSGWGNNGKVSIALPNGDTYHGYFWNRSHLLAKSLGGEEIEQNLICGTRMQNVGCNLNGSEGGMAYAETLARDWLDEHPDGYVYYAATPVYAGNELVCRNVVVDVRSSDGALDCELVVYNAANGYNIDYATGTFTAAGGS